MGIKHFPSVYYCSLVQRTHPRCQYWDPRLGKICGFSDHSPLTLFSGGIHYIKESVQLCTGRSKLFKELKFHDDKYLWKREVHLGCFLVNLCLFSFLQSLLIISPFLFSLTIFFYSSCCLPCPHSNHDILSCISLYDLVPFHELTNSIGLRGHTDKCILIYQPYLLRKVFYNKTVGI